MAEYNAYCDESCHLAKDDSDVMTLGAVWVPREKIREVAERISEIKGKHGLKSHAELKWTKIHKMNVDCYLELIDYFFDDDDLHFRCLVAKDKSRLNHEQKNQTHDDWYYKMYFLLLKNILSSNNRYHIFIDKKDTLGSERVEKLREVLCNSIYDFNKKIIKDIKIIVSHDSSCLQMTDILIGAIGYLHRGLVEKNPEAPKAQVLNRIRERSQKTLVQNTLPAEHKLNLFIWTPDYGKTE